MATRILKKQSVLAFALLLAVVTSVLLSSSETSRPYQLVIAGALLAVVFFDGFNELWRTRSQLVCLGSSFLFTMLALNEGENRGLFLMDTAASQLFLAFSFMLAERGVGLLVSAALFLILAQFRMFSDQPVEFNLLSDLGLLLVLQAGELLTLKKSAIRQPSLILSGAKLAINGILAGYYLNNYVGEVRFASLGIDFDLTIALFALIFGALALLTKDFSKKQVFFLMAWSAFSVFQLGQKDADHQLVGLIAILMGVLVSSSTLLPAAPEKDGIGVIFSAVAVAFPGSLLFAILVWGIAPWKPVDQPIALGVWVCGFALFWLGLSQTDWTALPKRDDLALTLKNKFALVLNVGGGGVLALVGLLRHYNLL